MTPPELEAGAIVFVPRLVAERYRLDAVSQIGYEPSEVVVVTGERVVVRSLFSGRLLVVLRSALA